MYSTTAVGSIVATAVTQGMSAIATIPASVVAGVSAADSMDKYCDNTSRIKTIQDICNHRSEADIEYYDNKNAITIISAGTLGEI